MKTVKTKALMMVILLALGSAWLLPTVGKNTPPAHSLPGRVEVLEQQVADLTARVEALEGQSPTICQDYNGDGVINLQDLAAFTSDWLNNCP